MASSDAPAMLVELGYERDEASVTAELLDYKQHLRTIIVNFPDAGEIWEISDVESRCSESDSDTDSLSDCSSLSDADLESVVTMIPVRPAAQPPVVIRPLSHRRWFVASATQWQTPSFTDASNSAASAAEDGGIAPRVSFIDVGDGKMSAAEDEDIPRRVTFGSGPGSRVPLSAVASGFAALWLRSHLTRC